jgi:hypothetical protein
MLRRPSLVIALAALPLAATAQPVQQKVTGPIAVYWVSAETRGGMAGPGGGGGLGGLVAGALLGGPAQGGRFLTLQLGSSQSPAGAPDASHFIPGAMNMGPALPLVTPVAAKREREPHEPPEDWEREKPKGRMLIYWGCGEQTRAGQPIVIDFARLAAGQAPNFPAGVRVNVARGPAFGRNRSYGDWPNPKDHRPVPGNASLVGEHQVKGNYSPEIRFAVDAATDFMPAPQFGTPRRTPGGGMTVSWQPIPGATGWHLSTMGANRDQDLILWSSSEIADMGWALATWLAPAEVARLVRERVVLAPSVTECTVPAEVIRQAESPLLNFNGYGPELNVIHPPRPADPKITWEQIYWVKVRQRTGAMLMLAEQAAGARRGADPAPTPADPAPPAQPAAAPTVTDAIKEGVGGVLRGIFGR